MILFQYTICVLKLDYFRVTRKSEQKISLMRRKLEGEKGNNRINEDVLNRNI